MPALKSNSEEVQNVGLVLTARVWCTPEQDSKFEDLVLIFTNSGNNILTFLLRGMSLYLLFWGKDFVLRGEYADNPVLIKPEEYVDDFLNFEKNKFLPLPPLAPLEKNGTNDCPLPPLWKGLIPF